MRVLRGQTEEVMLSDHRQQADPFLHMESIHKRFPGVHALKGVDLSLRHGEIRGLVGENGAGKSTLMNVLGGVVVPDSGVIRIDDVHVQIEHPSRAEELGIAFVHQELSLFNNMDVATNLFIHDLPSVGTAFVDRRELRKRSDEILTRIGLSPSLASKRIGRLTMGERQLVEIGRCLVRDPRLIILDEPTSSLTARETRTLFEIIGELSQHGVAFIYISHRLEEIFEMCNSVTIMRDGETRGTFPVSEIDHAKTVELMVGRAVEELYTHTKRQPGKPVLTVEGITREGVFEDISFTVHQREIVGFYGLMSAGRTEIARAIFGLDPIDSGHVRIEGSRVRIRSPRDAVRKGIAFVTENRREEGLDLVHSVRSNLTLASLSELRSSLGFLEHRREREMATKDIKTYGIRTPSAEKQVKHLSGGNQQKVVIAKWQNTEPQLVILDEPTRGIDVGAKREVFTLVDDALDRGIAVLLISSEISEIVAMCDRVIVIRGGKSVAELIGNQITEKEILSHLMGV